MNLRSEIKSRVQNAVDRDLFAYGFVIRTDSFRLVYDGVFHGVENSIPFRWLRLPAVTL